MDPDPETLERLKEKKARQEEEERLLLEIRDLPDVTRDGARVELYANIGGPEDVEAVLGSRGAGVACSGVNFYIWKRRRTPQRTSCFLPTARQQSAWAEERWSSAPWTLGQIRRQTILA